MYYNRVDKYLDDRGGKLRRFARFFGGLIVLFSLVSAVVFSVVAVFDLLDHIEIAVRALWAESPAAVIAVYCWLLFLVLAQVYKFSRGGRL